MGISAQFATNLRRPNAADASSSGDKPAAARLLSLSNVLHARRTAVHARRKPASRGVNVALRATRLLLLLGTQRAVLWQNTPGAMPLNFTCSTRDAAYAGRGQCGEGESEFAVPGKVRQELVLRALPAARCALPALHRRFGTFLNAVLQICFRHAKSSQQPIKDQC